MLAPPTVQHWSIRPADTNVYFLSGTFTVTTPTNHVAKNSEDERTIWRGTLELPKLKISVPKQ